jgi:hypothetical protein
MQKHVDEQKIPRKFSKKYVKVPILSHRYMLTQLGYGV